MLGGAGVVGMAEDVAGAVDARAFAVPDAEHTVISAFAAKLGLLRAPERGRRQILVKPRLETDIVPIEELAETAERLVEAAERRAAVAGYVAGGIEAVRGVGGMLHHGQPDDRLAAGHIDLRLRKIVFVVEADLGERHGTPPSRKSETY